MDYQESIVRSLYTSDVILADKETEMMSNVDDSYFDYMEQLQSRIEDQRLEMSNDEFEKLEEKASHFYFEYGYVQFKRGLELGLALRSIH